MNTTNQNLGAFRFIKMPGLILALLVLIGLAAHAANITFTAPATSAGNSDVLSMGGQVYAYDWGTATTVNGVAFTASTATGNVGSGSITLAGFQNAAAALFVSTSAPYTNLSSAYQNLLKCAVYSNTATAGFIGTATLNNLQMNHAYALQVWVNDSRGGVYSNRLEWIYDGNGGATNLLSLNTSHTNGGVGQYIWGTFTADGASQTFVLDNDAPGNPANNNILQLNAVQLRDVTGVWSGTSSGTWSGSDSSSANFTGLSYQAVQGTGATNVYFGDVDGLNNPVATTAITVAAGGVSGENVVFQNNSKTYTFNSADTTGIGGSQNVTLNGTNTVTFNGAHTYTGNTMLGGNARLVIGASGAIAGSTSLSLGANAILTVGNSSALTGVSTLTLAGGSLLDASSSSLPLGSSETLSGSGAIKGNVTAASGATIIPGGLGSIGTLSFSNNLTLNGQAFSFDLGATASGPSDKIVVGGTLTLNGNSTISLNVANGTLFNGTYTLLTYGSKSGGGNFVLSQAYPGMALNNNSTSVTLTVTGGLTGGGTSSIWVTPTGGNWTTVTNWQGSVTATNVDALADFSTLTLPANETVNVNSTNITIGYMAFADVGQTYQWTLSGGTNTLAVSSGSPTITVGTNTQANVSSVLAGSQGFTVEGPGILVVSGANTVTNGIYVINGGSLATTKVTGLSSMTVSPNNPLVLSNGFFEFATSGAQYFTNDLYVLGGANTTNIVYQGSSAQDSFVGRIFGSGVLNIQTPAGVVIGQRGDMSGFTGTVLVTGTAAGNNAAGLILANGDNTTGISGSANAIWDYEGCTLNYLYSGSPTATNYMGALMGNKGSVIVQCKNGTGTTSGNVTAEIGALNMNTSFAGKFRDYANANTGTAPPQLGIRKVGTGTLTLSGANVNTGPSEVRAGWLTVSGSYAAAVTVDSAATFELSGALSSPSVTVNSGSTFLVDNGGNLGSAAILVNGLMDVSAWAGSFSLNSASLSGSGVVTGAVTLASTTINPGPIGGAGTLTITNGSFTAAGGTLQFDLSSNPTSGNDLLVVNGNLDFSTPGVTISINKISGSLSSGSTYVLAQGLTMSGSVANLTLVGANPSDTLVLTGTQLQLVVSAFPSLTWTGGAAGNLWDVGASANWLNVLTRSTFANNDAATFTNTGGTNPVVNIPATVLPASVLVTGSSNYTFVGAADIGGGASLTKSGSGTLTILNTNTFTGKIYLTGGTLAVGNAGTNGALSANITNSAALVITTPQDQTWTNTISGTGSLNKQGPGTLTLTAASTLTGPTTISSGTLALGDGSSANGLLGAGSVTNNSQLVFGEIAIATINNNVTGTGGIDNQAVGPLILSGVISGTCQLTNDSSAGTLFLTASNSYSGGTCINNGTVIVSDPTLHGLGSGNIFITDGTGTLQFAAPGTNVVVNNIELPADTTADQFSMPAVATVRLTGLLTGGAAGQITRFVNVSAGGDNREVLILDNPANTFTTVPETYFGTLAFTSDGALGNPTNCISVNVGNKPNTQFYSLASDGLTFASNNITLNASRSINLVGTENINVQSFNGTIAGPITGFGLVKLGTGTLTLNGPGSIANSTTVSAGTLVVNNIWSGTNVTVSSGATLSGTGSINAAVQISSGGTLVLGTPATAALTVTSNLLLNSGSTVLMKVNAGTVTCDQIAGIGTLTYSGALVVTNVGGTFAAGQTYQLFSAAGYTGNFAATNLPPLSGLAWNWNPASGALSVVSGVATNPTNITATLSGGKLELSWPADHTGWRLLVQTNHLAAGLSSNTNDWATVPGSAGINQTNITMDPTKPAEFYRLVYP